METMALFLGLDPGSTGGLVILDAESRIALAVAWTDGDPARIVEAIEPHRNRIKLAALEKVASRPAQGSSSTFKFGAQFGMAVGVLTAFRVPFVLVRPQAWQASGGIVKPARLSAADVSELGRDGEARDEDARGRSAASKNRRELKRAIAEHAKRRWPGIPIRKQDDWAMADAAFLADHARRQHIGETLPRERRARVECGGGESLDGSGAA